jgi:plasmid stability protein
VPDLLIRNLDDEAHAELKRRAEASGLSLQSYVNRLLSEHVNRPTTAQWLERLDEIEPVDHVSGADAVQAARDELP